jgi:putative ABC transport system permease protein
MKIMDTKIFREIRLQKFRSILIISLVAITVTLIVGMRASYPMMMASYEENLILENTADGRFTFTSPFVDSNISELRDDTDFMESNNIAAIEGRIIMQTELKYNGDPFPAIVIGIDYPNSINKLNIQSVSSNIINEDNLLQNPDNCILEARFMGSLLGQDIPLDSNVSLDFGLIQRNLTIRASAGDPDFLYVVDPASQMTLMGQMAVVWMNLEELQNILFAGAPLVNQILFTVEDRLNNDMILNAADALSEKFAVNGMELGGMEFTLFDDTIDRKFFDADAGSVDKIGTIFGIIGLIVCSVIIFNTLSRVVQTQRRNIGLFMSMGSKARTIIFHYIKITMLLAIIGIIIGLPLGYLLSVGMTKMVVQMYGLSTLVFPIAVNEYLIGAFSTLAICAIFSGISAFPITTVTPRSAMSAVFNRIKATKASLSEKIFGWIPSFRNLHMLVPIREIFLRKKKSFVTIMAITTSMIILINSLAMVANIYTAINNNYTEYNTADIMIKLESPVSTDDINTFFLEHPDLEINHREVYISLFTKLSYQGKFQSWLELQCYQSNSTLRSINVVDGDNGLTDSLASDEIILGKSIAGKYDINIGDEIEVGTLSNYSVKVEALVGEMIDYSAFWTIENFQKSNNSDYFGIPSSYVNGILLDVKDDADLTAMREIFAEEFSIAQWTDSAQARESIMNLMHTIMGLLVMFILVGMGIGIIFSFSTMYMGFISRENDFLAFRAMGSEKKYIRKMIFWENVILSLFSLIVTIPVGYLFYMWSMDYMIGDRFYMPLSIPWYTWPGIFLLNVISIWLATGRMTKKIDKLVLADELRSRMVS